MLKKKSYILTLLVLLGTSCQTGQNKQATINNYVDTNKTVVSEPKLFDGYWILTDYFDSIFKDKTISKHRLYPIAWSAMTLKFQNDSLFSTGLLYLKKKQKICLTCDTLTLIKDFGTFILKYNKQTDNIEAIRIDSDKYNQFKNKTYTYRRVTEKHLITILANKNTSNIEEGFYQLFIDNLLAGEYKSIGNGQNKKIILSSNGLMNGFKKYNKYQIHDYFGTLHPFQNYDVIIFEDSSIVSAGSSTPSKSQIAYYSWNFTEDTLTLTELKTKNFGDEYFLGKQKFKFIKTIKHSH
jgi:hypothetical protein